MIWINKIWTRNKIKINLILYNYFYWKIIEYQIKYYNYYQDWIKNIIITEITNYNLFANNYILFTI